MGHKASKSNVTEDNHPKHYELTYLDASEPIGDTAENNADFIRDISSFKIDLPVIHVPKVDLGQC